MFCDYLFQKSTAHREFLKHHSFVMIQVFLFVFCFLFFVFCFLFFVFCFLFFVVFCLFFVCFLFCFVCFFVFLFFCFFVFLFVFCFVLFCFVLFCFVLFCFVLFCFVLVWFYLFVCLFVCFVLFCFFTNPKKKKKRKQIAQPFLMSVKRKRTFQTLLKNWGDLLPQIQIKKIKKKIKKMKINQQQKK